MSDREEIITNYINAYNQFDVDQMVIDFDPAIIFENVQNKTVTDSLEGINDFKDQANEAKNFFKERKQTILSFEHYEDYSLIHIKFHAVLSVAFTEKLNAGDQFEIEGQSIFEFTDDLKIKKLIDIS